MTTSQGSIGNPVFGLWSEIQGGTGYSDSGGGDTFTWIEAGGHGEVFSFTTVKRAPSPAFEAQVPYVVAIVALDEGPHLMTNIVDCDPDQVRIGDRVSVSFLDVEDASLPVFVKA